MWGKLYSADRRNLNIGTVQCITRCTKVKSFFDVGWGSENENVKVEYDKPFFWNSVSYHNQFISLY